MFLRVLYKKKKKIIGFALTDEGREYFQTGIPADDDLGRRWMFGQRQQVRAATVDAPDAVQRQQGLGRSGRPVSADHQNVFFSRFHVVKYQRLSGVYQQRVFRNEPQCANGRWFRPSARKQNKLDSVKRSVDDR